MNRSMIWCGLSSMMGPSIDSGDTFATTTPDRIDLSALLSSSRPVTVLTFFTPAPRAIWARSARRDVQVG
jgi:hypothetical protein